MSTSPRLQEMVAALIASPSISAKDSRWDMSNRPVAEMLANWLDPLGFRCDIQPLPGNPEKCNLIATLGKGDGGLVLAGHMDTVPHDETGWDSDPFALTEKDHRWVGLGTADMKAFLAFAVEAAAPFATSPLREPLIILATADEECGMDGARALVAAGKPKARQAVIGEPTGLKPVHSHKGIFMERIHVQGQAGHSSDPQLGNNAIEGMHRVLTALLQFRDELAQGQSNPAFHVAHSTLNVGCIHGGDSPNRIPAHCSLDVDLRFLPGMGLEGLRQELQSRAQRAIEGHGLKLRFEPLFEGINAFHTDPTADIVRSVEALSGARAGTADFATEGTLLNQLGMQTVVLGPGDIAQAHQPNESLSLDSIEPTRTLLSKLIQKYCL